MPERLYGIRHHGPGSARAVVQELSRQQPSMLLIEGPPEADELVRGARADALGPPVAFPGYPPEDPKQEAFGPFAFFPPEGQALKWAAPAGFPGRFFDLPFGYRLSQ